MNKNLGQIVRLDDYTKMIRDAGMVPGLSAHMPKLVVYSDEAEEDIEISLAAIEHRFPDLEKRSSPNQEQAAFGK